MPPPKTESGLAKRGYTFHSMSPCALCGADLCWYERRGKMIPFDPDFTPHVDTCSGAVKGRGPKQFAAGN